MKIFPEHLTESTLSDPMRSAEIKVYQALSKLEGPYLIFYSVAWQTRDRGAIKDGEADFVIAHPNYGVLVMEVKGGNINYDPVSGEWTSTDRYSQTHSIDPVEQVKKNKYALLEKIKDLPEWDRNSYLDIGHILCFPDLNIKQRSLRLDLPREIILDDDNLKNINQSIDNCFDYYRYQSSNFSNAIGPRHLEMIKGLLARSFNITTPLGVELEYEDQKLIELTDQQMHLLNFLGNRSRALISGCAGSGKTMLAIEKARILAEQGFNVLLTCFNVALAVDLAEKLPDITVLNFHNLCMDLAKQAGILLRKPLDDREYYDEILPDALMSASDDLDLRFDAIIVDEGQDFKENYWIALLSLLRDSSSIFYVFYDNNQNIFGGTPAIAGLLSEIPFTLNENCRNTKAIHQIVMNYHDHGNDYICNGPDGRKPKFLTYKDKNNLISSLQKILFDLVENEGIATKDIVILSPVGQSTTNLAPGTKLGNFVLVTQNPASNSEVQSTSIQKFKGLERRVVILAEVDRFYKQDPELLLYVACSRARTHLILLMEETTPKVLKEQIENHFELI